ncbi:TIGR01244 family phosphatase [Sphingomonas gilva]|uniref:TIGR01244 family phosphatase n=1 Tax=Sphingomonas gilva TaxID=2305907 RepID=A0A396RQ32_9SPHN|nr:TIGR01244 family sulfur transferase [Sphingomonas gilva]RHW18640.1 TIGR01244 family phosphatase [Sphingomonas gilva]
MTDIRPLDSHFAVAPQLTSEDLGPAAQAGYVALVNNRPDGEEANQPEGAEIARVAAEHGLSYRAIPVTHAGFSLPQVDALVEVIESANGPVLAYCRSGTRSANLWALARARLGDDADTLIEKAAGAGYDLSNLRPLLDQMRAAK